jgi:hypothetical protein
LPRPPLHSLPALRWLPGLGAASNGLLSADLGALSQLPRGGVSEVLRIHNRHGAGSLLPIAHNVTS